MKKLPYDIFVVISDSLRLIGRVEHFVGHLKLALNLTILQVRTRRILDREESLVDGVHWKGRIEEGESKCHEYYNKPIQW